MGDIDVERIAPIASVNRRDPRTAAERTGVGYQQVESTERVGRRDDESRERVGVGHVDRLAVRRPTALAQFGDGFVHALQVTSSDRDGTTLRSQRERDRAPDSP